MSFRRIKPKWLKFTFGMLDHQIPLIFLRVLLTLHHSTEYLAKIQYHMEICFLTANFDAFMKGHFRCGWIVSIQNNEPEFRILSKNSLAWKPLYLRIHSLYT
mmetsp:Transcript_4014/g.5410  ORF Transcript_4014/g.5410 Transcript_4014/m.5410 type:complete len:102 (+) Transcript_4014:135-440(+)